MSGPRLTRGLHRSFSLQTFPCARRARLRHESDYFFGSYRHIGRGGVQAGKELLRAPKPSSRSRCRSMPPELRRQWRACGAAWSGPAARISTRSGAAWCKTPTATGSPASASSLMAGASAAKSGARRAVAEIDEIVHAWACPRSRITLWEPGMAPRDRRHGARGEWQCTPIQ